MKKNFSQRLTRATASIQSQADFEAELGVVVGSSLETILDHIRVEHRLDYADVDEFRTSSAPSHKGELVFGTMDGRKVVALNGRVHLYEGHDEDDVVLPIYALSGLGVRTIIITNASGGLRADLKIGAPVLISDQLNFTGLHPLAGPNDEELGKRFPDMSRLYDRELLDAARRAAHERGEQLASGIYAGVHGPEFETSAERRYLRLAGGDMVGMSSVLETIAARHAGMKVMGFSVVTNSATGGPEQQANSIEEVLENASRGAPTIKNIISHMIRNGSL